MKIMTLLGFLVLLTTSPMTNSFPGQRHAVPVPRLVYHPKQVAGSIFGTLALAVIVFRILLRPSPTNQPSTRIKPLTTIKPSTTIKPLTTNKPPPECPSGYTLNETMCGRFCYRLETLACLSFLDARRICQKDGADLLVPDVCSFPLFRDLAKQTEESSCGDYWVGAFRTLPEVKYVTVRGEALPDNFKFWADGQPNRNTRPGGEQETCVQTAFVEKYLLDNDVCDDEEGYICQKFIN